MTNLLHSTVTIKNFDVFLDLREQGYRDVIGGSLFTEGDDSLAFRFGHSLISDYTEDDWVGTHMHVVRSRDGGKTWSAPELVTLPRVKDLRRESFSFGPFFRTREGTVLYTGIHQVLDAADGTHQQDLSMRDYMLLYARQEKGQTDINIVEWPSGTFMGEQFLEGGLQLPSGRLLFTMWGVAQRGENWRCGVLISDDDGKNWRFNTVGYEPDLAIRDNPTATGYPAGFNEQTLFLTKEGTIVSIIRGREKLGRGVPGGGGEDTWFFRAESRDEGETWTKPEPTNLPGTGATIGQGLTLPDGSLLIGCRIPYSREYYDLPEQDLYGLNLARSFDNGKTWTPQFIQRDPEGNGFTTHHCAMNGFFRKIAEDRYEYIFGFFGHAYEPKLQRMLRLTLKVE
ncbi:MAG: sialidase family protein [Armatimonadota bacterium]